MDWWDWIGKIEPGSWSEWVGAILTGGSLLLGFSILRRDRLKEDRAQAAQLLTMYIDAPKNADLADTRPSHVAIKNTSDLPMSSLQFNIRPLGSGERGLVHRMAYGRPRYPYRVFLIRRYLGDSLEAGATWAIDLPFEKSEAVFYSASLSGLDAAGRFHSRQVTMNSPQKFLGVGARLRDAYVVGGFAIETWVRRAKNQGSWEDGTEEYQVRRLGRRYKQPKEIEPLDGRGTE